MPQSELRTLKAKNGYGGVEVMKKGGKWVGRHKRGWAFRLSQSTQWAFRPSEGAEGGKASGERGIGGAASPSQMRALAVRTLQPGLGELE